MSTVERHGHGRSRAAVASEARRGPPWHEEAAAGEHGGKGEREGDDTEGATLGVLRDRAKSAWAKRLELHASLRQ